MAKKDDKRLASDPFERFLPQIDDSRKKKDDDVNSDASKDVDKNVDDDVNKTKNDDKNKINDVDVNVNKDDDKVVNNAVNISTDEINVDAVDVIDGVSENVSTNDDDGNDSVVSSDVAVSANGTITIARKKNKSGDYLRATYYLRPDQIRTINRLHKDSGRDKSELVRMAVDILIKQARVE